MDRLFSFLATRFSLIRLAPQWSSLALGMGRFGAERTCCDLVDHDALRNDCSYPALLTCVKYQFSLIPVNFGPFIAYTNIDPESLNILREYINDIMK
jgi:hypothetical protein